MHPNPNHIPPNGAVVYLGTRRGTVSRTGHPPTGVIVEVLWDDTNTLAWHPAADLSYEPATAPAPTKAKRGKK